MSGVLVTGRDGSRLCQWFRLSCWMCSIGCIPSFRGFQRWNSTTRRCMMGRWTLLGKWRLNCIRRCRAIWKQTRRLETDGRLYFWTTVDLRRPRTVAGSTGMKPISYVVWWRIFWYVTRYVIFGEGIFEMMTRESSIFEGTISASLRHTQRRSRYLRGC